MEAQMDEKRDIALTQMRKSVEKLGSSAEGYGEPTLMRFLIARSMEPDKAAKMFVQWQKWRAAMVPNGSIPESDVPDELKARKIYLQGLSQGKYPVMIVQARNHYPSKDQIQFKTHWWRMYGHSSPNLQKLAIKILSLTCSASGCKHNWSIFEHIHSKKINRLEHQRLEDLVFVKYNQVLKQRYNLIDEIDPIALNDIDECNEWLVGELGDDDNNDDDTRNELVFVDDETLNWDLVFRASGIGEPRTNTRQQSRKRKRPSGGGASASQARVSKKGKIVVSDEEPEFEDLEESEEEEEIQFHDLESEEEERHANDHNDYDGGEDEN